MIEFAFEDLRQLGLSQALAPSLAAFEAPPGGPHRWARVTSVHRETLDLHDGHQPGSARCAARLARDLWDQDSALAVGDWVYNNFDDVGGVSFLPYTDHVYQQAPYTECSEAEYEELASKMPTVAWSRLREFEKEDTTTNQQTLACSAGACEIL